MRAARECEAFGFWLCRDHQAVLKNLYKNMQISAIKKHLHGNYRLVHCLKCSFHFPLSSSHKTNESWLL